MNTQLYSSREKEGLAHLVQIMINYNMTYRQERSPEGQYSYVLDPLVCLHNSSVISWLWINIIDNIMIMDTIYIIDNIMIMD